MVIKEKCSSYENIVIFESKENYFICGLDSFNKNYAILQVKRPKSIIDQDDVLELQVLENFENRDIDLSKWMSTEYKASLIHDNVKALFGFVKLSESFYLIIVTDAIPVATIHGQLIYSVQDTAMLPITYRIRNTSTESKYQQIIQSLKFKDEFYFSYTYPLFNNLQNHLQETRFWNAASTTNVNAEGLVESIDQIEDRFTV